MHIELKFEPKRLLNKEVENKSQMPLYREIGKQSTILLFSRSLVLLCLLQNITQHAIKLVPSLFGRHLLCVPFYLSMYFY